MKDFLETVAWLVGAGLALATPLFLWRMATSKRDIQEGTGQAENYVGRGYGRGYGWGYQYKAGTNSIGALAGNPIQGEIGYMPSALFQNPLGTIGNLLWLNIGTFNSANWVDIDGMLVSGSLKELNLSLNASATTTFNLTAAQLMTAQIPTIIFNGTTGGSASVTLDSTKNLIAAVPNAMVGNEFRARFVNETGSTLTVIHGDASTVINGNATIGNSAWRDFDLFFNTVTGAGSITLTNIGAGTV